MKITASTVSLTVDDAAASGRFLVDQFGFEIAMQAPGFVSLTRADSGLGVVFLDRGLQTMPAAQRDLRASGLIVAFEVEDLEGELLRLETNGVEVTMPLTVEEWGERAFQVKDPNGVVFQLVDWKGPVDPAYASS